MPHRARDIWAMTNHRSPPCLRSTLLVHSLDYGLSEKLTPHV